MTDDLRRSVRVAPVCRVLLLLVVLLSLQDAAAQVQIEVRRVHREWPRLRLEFRATYNGQPIYTIDSSLFRVREDGIDVSEFQLYCPPPTIACLVSGAFLFDVGPGMTGTPLADAKTDGRFLVDLMANGDEGTILAVGPTVQTRRGWTANKDSLRDAIDSLRAAPATAALWDAIYEGVLRLAGTATNPCRHLVVFTTGADSGSSRSMAECIALANQHRLRVFPIGLGANVQTTALQNLANLTGGRFLLNPNASQLQLIRQEVATIIFTGMELCSISFEPRCKDGSIRTVDLAIVNYMGGSDTATCTYGAARDTSTFAPMHLELGSAMVRGGRDTTLPLLLSDTIFEPTNFYPATWTVAFDKSRLQFLGVEAPVGTVLEHTPVTATPIPGGLRLSTAKRTLLVPGSTPAVLAGLRFRASDPEGKDTVHCPVSLSAWNFEAGCFRPVLESGAVHIVPRRPAISATIAAPVAAEWSAQLGRYIPDVIDVRVALSNSGNREARNTLCTLEYDTADFVLIAPTATVIPSIPAAIPSGAQANAQWVLHVRNRLTADSLPLCVTVRFDNYDSLRLCTMVHVARAGAALACAAAVPVISADAAAQRYSPMPFDVVVRVRNEGGETAAGVSAQLDLPPGLHAIGEDRPGWSTQRIAAALGPGAEAEAHWTLRHEPVVPTKEYTLVVRMTAENAAGSACETRLVIPALNAPVLAPACSAPDSLRFNASTGVYEPDPFTVTLACTNTGNMPAVAVRAMLSLPAHVSLADSGDTPGRNLSALLPPWKPGDSIPRVSWRLRTREIPRHDTAFHIRVAVYGTTTGGLPIDSAIGACRVFVPGVAPAYASHVLAPDSLARNAAETDVTPNPFVVTHQVWNRGRQTARLLRAELVIPPGEGILFDAATPARRVLNRTLPPGDTASVAWVLRAEKHHTRRLVPMRASMTDEDGHAIDDLLLLPIANPRLAFVTLLTPECDAPDSLHVDIPTGTYSPQPFRVTLRCVNRGGAPATGVRATLALPRDVVLAETRDSLQRNFPSPMLEWKQGDPVPEVAWDLRYTGRPRFDRFIDFRCSIGGTGPGGSALDSVHVQRSVRIPGLAPSLTLDFMAPDSLFENATRTDVEPNPFVARAVIKNVSRQTGTIEQAELLVIPADAVAFDPRTPRQRVLHADIAPGDSLTVAWTIRVHSVQHPRVLAIRAIAADVEGNILEQRRNVAVEGVLSPVTHVAVTDAPRVCVLHQNAPNPFTAATRITLDVAAPSPVLIQVVDVLGRVVCVLADRHLDVGRYEFAFAAGPLPAGVYVCRVDAADFHDSILLVLAR